MTEFYTVKETKLFYPGAQYPPQTEIRRLAKYERGRKIFEGRHAEIYDRASALLKDTPHAPQLKTLFIAVNIVDVLVTKPADLLVGEKPTYNSGKGPDSTEQSRLNSIVEENDLNQMIHETTVGGGYRGDSFVKVRYDYRDDFTETDQLELDRPPSKKEPIIETVDPSIVFPELARGSKKRFKAVNVAWVEWEIEQTRSIMSYIRGKVALNETPFLNVERHIPGYIVYERYKLIPNGVDTSEGVPIPLYIVGEKVETGREETVTATGTPHLNIDHIPHKTTDDHWAGISTVEKMESKLAAINDRLVQIDYILWKHSDPTAYGPDIDEGDERSVRFGGKYIPLEKDDVVPGYMTWNSQLDGAFKELELLLGLIYQMAETPQWLFGTTITSDSGGTGTSHTDGAAIKARFMPILKKVERIRTHVDRAVRNALWKAMLLENIANKGVPTFEPYDEVYPTIGWRDGIPRNEKEAAEVASIRTGAKPTWSVTDAIKDLDGVTDAEAEETIRRIDEDEKRVNGTVDGTIFNEEVVV
ncbi:phage portal protein [Paenibacillus illinoisensis]|uniref:phage portal protein n=1 Tax=Paenibacillus illinoisensis TaxID=59845 RepID=UPI00203FB93B|nr:phage portal protein [Paenibacillus illinoisensis]MCM3205622.1 phage portal protein [Paenibacillus illinoisensis]